MKRVSLSSLAVNAPPETKAESRRPARSGRAGQRSTSEKVTKITSDEANEMSDRVQVAFRMEKDAYKDLKRMALDEDTTVNELVVRSINALREAKGLKKLSA
jgi:hypothetical protein